MEELNPFHIIGRNVKWCNHSRKHFLKPKQATVYNPTNALLGIYPRAMRAYVRTKPHIQTFIAALLIIETGNNSEMSFLSEAKWTALQPHHGTLLSKKKE